jgi:hypothetical protein
VSEDAVIAADRASARTHHVTYLVMIAVALALSAILSTDASGDVAIAAGGRLLHLPPLCPLRAFTGMKCPGCGLTRAFVLIAHGRFEEAEAMHRVSLALFFAALWQLWYRPWMIRRAEVLPPEPLRTVHRIASWALIAALLGSWVYDVARGVVR